MVSKTSKAYDSVRREVLFNVLIEFGISMKLLRLIKMCLNETSSRVWEGKHLPDKFPLRNGLKKGVALSPFLLNFALGYAIRIVQVNQDGLKLMLNPLTSTIVASPSNARNANVCFRTTFVWQH